MIRQEFCEHTRQTQIFNEGLDHITLNDQMSANKML